MSPVEQTTYFGYNEGFDPQLLRLGTLVFDYANPRTKEPYFHHEVKEVLAKPAIATADERLLCALSQAHDGKCSLGFGLKGLLDFEHSRSGATYRLVVGKNGSKVQLISADDFFKDFVLKEEAARHWLRTRLSVAHKMCALYQNVVSAPKIWLLTGIYLIDDAATYRISSKSSSNAVSVNVPIPEPSGIAALLGVSAGTRFDFGRGSTGVAETQILGRKVWAAQWHRVDAKYVSAKESSWDANSLVNQVKILDVLTLGAERGESDEIEIAEVKPAGNEATAQDGELEKAELDNKVEYDDAMWQRFEEEVDDLLEELEEEN